MIIFLPIAFGYLYNEERKRSTSKIKEFIKYLGEINDFVSYIKVLEKPEEWNKLKNSYTGGEGFSKTPNNKRYLAVKNGPTKIIDFRHFFASMYLTSDGAFNFSTKSVGGTLLLGVGQEIKQCFSETGKSIKETWVSESLQYKINSCFSNEDLGSNRLGAQFGEIILKSRSINSKETLASMLFRFLIKLEPLTVSDISKLQINSSKDNIAELVIALIVGVKDTLITNKAY